MRIAHLVSTFPPYQGGMGNSCYYQVKELIDLGHDIVVFTPWYGDEKLKIKNEKLKIIYLNPVFKYGNAAFIPKVTKYLKNFDLIHLHHPFLGAGEIIWLKKFFYQLPIPLVLQYHMDLIFPGPGRFLSEFYNRIFTLLILTRVKKIIVSSFDYARNSYAINKFFRRNEKKFVEIPFGVDSDNFKPQEKNENLLKKYNFQKDDKIILFVGGLDKSHYFKGVDVLLRAVNKLKIEQEKLKTKLLIVGKGNLKPRYEKLARDLKMENEVIFTGAVPDKDLPNYYHLADIFVLPSITRSEAFGIVLLEAMACGKPCLASNLPGVRTVVDDQKTGFLVEPRNQDDLAKKIKILLENDNLRKKMGEAGRKKVEEKYQWLEIAKKIEKLYEDVSKN